MAVVLPNCQLRVRKRAHPAPRDAHGTPIPAALGAALGPWPGAAKEQEERGTWSLRVDPAAWPLNPGDEVSDGARTWVVATAVLHAVQSCSAADYVAVVGRLNPPDIP
ncbi:MAG TPA: hypothetical protein VFP72_08845 [Kineosporiaceae bacterium]|nr:hypothetical protein [Kineosporiaceae bacterium]